MSLAKALKVDPGVLFAQPDADEEEGSDEVDPNGKRPGREPGRQEKGQCTDEIAYHNAAPRQPVLGATSPWIVTSCRRSRRCEDLRMVSLIATVE